MAGGEAMALGYGTNHGFARKLASSDKSTREKAVSLLVLWLSCQQEISEDELKKIWKGLFYCVWHADKAPVQSELIERLASLLEKLDVELSISFFKVFLSTMRREWGGIDRLRLDKFYLLLRKFLFYMFVVLDKGGWEKELVSNFMCALEERVFLAKDRYPALGVKLHITDIYLDEFRKFLPVPERTLGLLLEPFHSLLASSSEKALLKRVRENIFIPLLDDARALVKDIDAQQSVEGMASSLGYLLQSNPVAPRLFDIASSPSTPQANRKLLYELHGEFITLAKSFDSLESVTFHSNGNGKCSAGNTDGVSEVFLEETDGGSRTRPRKRQDREGVGKYSLQELGVYKVESKKGKKLEAAANGLSDVKTGLSVPNGEYLDLEDGGNEGKEATEVMKNTSSVDFERVERPLLHKRKEKKGKPKIAEADLKDGEFSVSGIDSSLLERGRNGHQGQHSQALSDVSESIGNGHEDVSDVTINLEKKFDFVAAEELVKSLTNISTLPASPLRSARETRSDKKRKRDKGVAQGTLQSGGFPDCAENGASSTSALQPYGKVDIDKQNTPTDSAKKAKKVRFAMRSNLIFRLHGPLPPLSVRTPPSATPRGSALKSGVLPGPIRTRPLRVARGAFVVRSRKRASRQLLSMSLQKPARKVRNRQSL